MLFRSARGPKRDVDMNEGNDDYLQIVPVDFSQNDMRTIELNPGYRVDFTPSNDKGRKYQRYSDYSGHAFVVIGADEDGLQIVTWGRAVKVTWEWWDYYMGDSSFNFYRNYEAYGDTSTTNVKGGEVWVVSPTKFLDSAQLRQIDMEGNKVNGIVQWIVNNAKPWF